MKKKKMYAAVILLICVCMSCSIYLTYDRAKGLLRDEYENELRVKSGMISSVVSSSFIRPVAVSETMSKDVMMYKILDFQKKDEAAGVEDEAKEYLKSIRDGFGYYMVFAVNDATKAYFTYDGISRFMNPDTDERDAWYKTFLERDTNRRYTLDVDTDEVNNWTLSVFVNTAVYDPDGNYLGVCGIGVDMSELQRLLERLERAYDVSINLIDQDGLIQVDTDVERIERDYIEIDDPELYSDGECYYEIGEDGSRTITYIDDLGWYLVVKNNSSFAGNVYGLLIPSIVCMILCVLLVGGVFCFSARERRGVRK